LTVGAVAVALTSAVLMALQYFAVEPEASPIAPATAPLADFGAAGLPGEAVPAFDEPPHAETPTMAITVIATPTMGRREARDQGMMTSGCMSDWFRTH
jgi:hypothetical protein